MAVCHMANLAEAFGLGRGTTHGEGKSSALVAYGGMDGETSFTADWFLAYLTSEDIQLKASISSIRGKERSSFTRRMDQDQKASSTQATMVNLLHPSAKLKRTASADSVVPNPAPSFTLYHFTALGAGQT
ncbi:hypothetical protein AK812_SmicGene34097 [Symbiodinium microadriaticum]|uniref:Uncharacterized protein n=1 Tax=Symbiodinium microadriaticum TaxID=2951 RepID=A0A1Q9CQ11_SYMMI|nr:hypothetical protein AK812_SmicGene34097 [Symbiodinium microadriaticum]